VAVDVRRAPFNDERETRNEDQSLVGSCDLALKRNKFRAPENRRSPRDEMDGIERQRSPSPRPSPPRRGRNVHRALSQPAHSCLLAALFRMVENRRLRQERPDISRAVARLFPAREPEGTPNIEHPTPNIEWQRELSLTSAFGVRCWMFDVFPRF